MALKRPPFWIEGADEICSHCGHPHAHGAGHHCAACDANVCLLCFEFEGGDVLCIPCRPKKKAAAKPKKKGVRSWLRRVRSGKV